MNLPSLVFTVLLISRLSIVQIAYGQRTPNTTNAKSWFEHLSVNQGLSHNTVLCIYQDREGFMWFGTQDGLNKYDGYTFTVYAPDPTDPDHTIGHSWVTTILEDQRNQLWVTTMGGGLYRIDKQSGQVKGYRISKNPTDPRNTCFSMAEDQNGLLWIGSAGGLNCFDPQTGQFALYKAPTSDDPAIFAVCVNNSGDLWIGCATGLYRFNSQTKNYSTKAILNGGIFAAISGQQATIWTAASSYGLCQLRLSDGQPRLHHPPNIGSVRKQFVGKPLYQDAVGSVWTALSDQSGLQQFNPATGKWTIYQAKSYRPGRLSSNLIYAIYQDRSGILWVGTDNGLDLLMPHGSTFQTLQPLADDHKARLPQNRIRALCEDHTGTIWVSTKADQFYSFHPTINRFTWQPTTYPVNAIYEDAADRLWLGTDDALALWNRQTSQAITYRCEINIHTIHEAPDGKLWLSGPDGLAVFNPVTTKFSYYRQMGYFPTGFRSQGITMVLPSHRKGTVWIATNDQGLVKLNLQTDQFTYYQPNTYQQAGRINDKDIRSLYEDASGILWIGTNQGGLNRFDPKTSQFMAFTKHDGLPNNHVVSIEPDRSGHLWLATNQGLCRFNPRTKAVHNYDQSDGLQDNEFYEVYANTPTGQLLFGGPNGFNLIDPTSIQANRQPPPVYITQLQVLNQPRPIAQQPIGLSYQENLLSFEFVALNFIRPQKNQYAYQLVGIDAGWVYGGNRRFATYSHLAPGNYVFRVKAANNDGVWNERSTQLRFVIYPPFWRTGWFISLSVVAFAGLGLAGFQYRIRQIRREEAQKTVFHKRLAETEMQALRAQMNPHFIFNSLNSINSFILANEPEAASDYLSKFSKLIRLILQHSNEASISLASELEALRLYLVLETLRFTNQFTFSIDVADDVPTALIEIPPLILQPYVENAIWHGLMHRDPGGYLTISIRKQANQFVYTIEDNGVGRQKSAQLKSKSATRTKSLGMQITSHRLQLSQTLRGQKPTITITDLIDFEGESAGTRVVLTIPTD